MANKKIIAGVLTFIISLTAITVYLYSQGLSISVSDASTKFSVFENNKWNTSGIEYNSIMNGTKKLARLSCSRLYNITNTISTIDRLCFYAGNVTVMDRYVFTGAEDAKEMFPIEHMIVVFGKSKYKYQYEVKNTRYLSEEPNQFILAKNMKVKYSDGYSSKKHTATTVTLQYPLSDFANVFYIRLYDPISAGINITIIEDGQDADRYYELGTTANISIYTNATATSRICVDIDQPAFGVNYTCNITSNNFTIMYQQNDITFNRLADQSLLKNVSNNTFVNITLYDYTDLISFTFGMRGISYPMTYPYNLLLFLNTTQIAAYPGYLEGTMLRSNTFTDRLQTQNLTYVSASTQVKYANYSNASSYTVNNLTFKLWGYQADPNSFSFTEKFYNLSNVTFGQYYQSPVWWDDYSKGDSLSHWSGDYTLTSNYVQASASGTVTYVDCNHLNGGSTDTVQTAGLDFQNKNLVQFKLITETCSSTGAKCCAQPAVSTASSSSAGIIDDTLSTTTIFTSGAYNGIISVYKENGYLNWYEGTTYKGQIAYISSHSYEIYGVSNWAFESNYNSYYGDYCSAQCAAAVYIYPINQSGVTTAYNGNMQWNNTNQTIVNSTLLYVASKNITRAKLTLDLLNPTSGTIYPYMSVNNGTTWETVVDGNFKIFSTIGNKLRVRLNISNTDKDTPIIVQSYNIELVTGTPSNIKVDLFNDGIIDFNMSGIFNETNSPLNVSLSNSLIDDYISTSNIVPIGISTDSAGVVGISHINITQNISSVDIPTSILNPLRANGNTNISFNFSYRNGTIEINNLRQIYLGDLDVNVTAHVNSSSYSRLVKWRYSTFNLTFPAGVNYFEMFPSSRIQSNIQPYGQNSTYPIWKLATYEKHNQKVDIYAKLNSSDTSCMRWFNLTSSNFSNFTCYQETATTATTCGGLSTGQYSSNAEWNDGSWSSYSLLGVYYVNYSIPPNALNTSIWIIGPADVNGALVQKNISINSSCWRNPLQFKINSTDQVLNAQSRWECFNGLTWNILYSTGDAFYNYRNVYEEAMNWSIYTVTSINLSNSPQHISTQQINPQIANIYSYASINCTGYNKAFLLPYMCFFSMCSNCTFTSDWNDTCDVWK